MVWLFIPVAFLCSQRFTIANIVKPQVVASNIYIKIKARATCVQYIKQILIIRAHRSNVSHSSDWARDTQPELPQTKLHMLLLLLWLHTNILCTLHKHSKLSKHIRHCARNTRTRKMNSIHIQQIQIYFSWKNPLQIFIFHALHILLRQILNLTLDSLILCVPSIRARHGQTKAKRPCMHLCVVYIYTNKWAITKYALDFAIDARVQWPIPFNW